MGEGPLLTPLPRTPRPPSPLGAGEVAVPPPPSAFPACLYEILM